MQKSQIHSILGKRKSQSNKLQSKATNNNHKCLRNGVCPYTTIHGNMLKSLLN